MIQIQPKMTDTQRKPNVSLKCIEYLILSIQSHPGKGQRFHLRRLHQYQHGFEDYHSGGTNNGFFTSKSYRDVLWTDVAPKTVEYATYFAVNGVGMKPNEAQMYLTRRGWNRANTIRGKIGLPSLDWSAQELPDRGACRIYQTGV